MNPETQIDDLRLLTEALPAGLQAALAPIPAAELLEIVLDLGRTPQARTPERAIDLAAEPVTREALEEVVARVGRFGRDNRAGIEGTLHRISAIRNRAGDIVGLTLRVGRTVAGTIDPIRDLVESGAGLLLLGRPGVGKTTKLREVARVLADDFGKRVVIIDTSNEIGGDGDVPHPAIGGARRMQVASPERQHAVMIEAVENHMPEVIIVDEIGTEAEALAARTIAERGVQLVGTAHGNTLENLVANPTLSDLVGGIQTVTLGDEEARLRGTQKTVRERRAAPTFEAVVEIVDRELLIVHDDTARAVDNLLRGRKAGGVRRGPAGEPTSEPLADRPEPPSLPAGEPHETVRLYPYALGRDNVERVIRTLDLDARLVTRPERADRILTLRSRADDPRLQRIVEDSGAEVLTVKKNSTSQLRRLLEREFHILHGVPRADIDAALAEARAAVERARRESVTVALPPRPAALRELQQRYIMRERMVAESVGSEPRKHLRVHP